MSNPRQPWSQEEMLEYIAHLEDLVEDIDATGIDNFCSCGQFNDSRCCWIKRSWEYLQDLRTKHFGGRWRRLTKRIDREEKFPWDK